MPNSYGPKTKVQKSAANKMPKPIRDPEFLEFIRSLPCCVCFRTRTVETAHVGRRGMGQKSSDRETIPLCSLHHREQHRIGLRQFSRDHELNIPQLLAQLNEKPRLFVLSASGSRRYWFATYRDECFKLLPAEPDIDNAYLSESVRMATHLCREYLIEQLFTSNVRGLYT